MIPIQETIYYQDASPVFISSERIIFFNYTFSTRSIISVAIKPVIPKRTSAVTLLCIGLVMALMGLLALQSPKNSGYVIFTDVLVLVGGICFMVWGIYKYFTVAPIHSLELGTPSGPAKAIVSPDYGYIDTLKRAIERAVYFSNNP